MVKTLTTILPLVKEIILKLVPGRGNKKPSTLLRSIFWSVVAFSFIANAYMIGKIFRLSVAIVHYKDIAEEVELLRDKNSALEGAVSIVTDKFTKQLSVLCSELEDIPTDLEVNIRGYIDEYLERAMQSREGSTEQETEEEPQDEQEQEHQVAEQYRFGSAPSPGGLYYKP